MGLTAKREAFCLAYVEACNASEAYRRAYPRSLNWKPETVHRKASLLLNNGEVMARLNELREPVREAAKITLFQHLEDMRRLRDAAEDAGQFGPAIKAEECRAKASGLYVDRKELTGPDGKPLDLSMPSVVIIEAGAGDE